MLLEEIAFEKGLNKSPRALTANIEDLSNEKKG